MQERRFPFRLQMVRVMASADAIPSARALEAAYRREWRVLHGFFRRSVRNDDAADLVQEVFTRAASAGNFAEIIHHRSYLMQIARNLLIDRWRAKKRANGDFAPFEEERTMIAQPDQFWWIESADRIAACQRAISVMPPKAREVFLMCRVDQLSYAEIGAELGLSRKGVEKRMRRALVTWRRACAAFGCDR